MKLLQHNLLYEINSNLFLKLFLGQQRNYVFQASVASLHPKHACEASSSTIWIEYIPLIFAGKWHQIFFNFQNMYEAIRSVTCVVSLSISSPWSWHAMIMITCHWCWVSKRWQHTTLYLLTNWLSSSYTCQALHDDYT